MKPYTTYQLYPFLGLAGGKESHFEALAQCEEMEVSRGAYSSRISMSTRSFRASEVKSLVEKGRTPGKSFFETALLFCGFQGQPKGRRHFLGSERKKNWGVMNSQTLRPKVSLQRTICPEETHLGI